MPKVWTPLPREKWKSQESKANYTDLECESQSATFHLCEFAEPQPPHLQNQDIENHTAVLM